MIVSIKRFDIFGKKVQRQMRYPAAFNLRKHMDTELDAKATKKKLTDPASADLHYDIYGVVIHSGFSTSSGHYYAYCRAGAKWFQCDDSHVSSSSEREALSQQAYLLFYEKR